MARGENNMNCVDKKLLKYVPAKLRQYCVWLDKETDYYDKRKNTYYAIFEKDNKEYSSDYVDSVSELTWNCKQILEEMEKNK